MYLWNARTVINQADEILLLLNDFIINSSSTKKSVIELYNTLQFTFKVAKKIFSTRGLLKNLKILKIKENFNFIAIEVFVMFDIPTSIPVSRG